jgi:hypothetical protein
MSGFVKTGITEDNETEYKKNLSKKTNFKTTTYSDKNNKIITTWNWDSDIVEFELTEETKGKFQVNYGCSYYVIIDDIKLEYQGGVITTALENLITKASALNAMLRGNADLTTAISNAEAFVAAPTTQDAVTTEVEKLYGAMSTAMTTATMALDITSVYVDNPSFETGTFGAWENEDAAVQDVPDAATSLVTQYCDGAKMVAGSGAPVLTQTITHLPAGYYLVSAKLAGTAKLVTGTTNTSVTGGSNMLYLRVYAPAFNLTEAGNLVIGAKGSGTFNIDDFHLYYAKDAATIEAIALAAVKADATAILAETQYANITGEERSETVTAIEGTDYKAVNTKLNKFVASKTAYNDFVAAQQKAAPYTSEAYPYADKDMLQLVATNCSATAQSSTSAKEMTTQLKNAIEAIPMSNAYCEGITNKTDLTDQIVGADATGSSVTGWTVNNIEICTLDKYKTRPVMGQTTKDATVYGTPNSYKSGTASIQQTLSNLAAGTYVLSVSIMATKDIPVDVRINGVKKNTFVGVGTGASSSWNEVVTTFELTETANVTLRLDEGADATTKLWYADNFRLYLISGGATAIRSVNSNTANTNAIFDLSGRRVAQPTKGLYIINGKKVVIK